MQWYQLGMEVELSMPFILGESMSRSMPNSDTFSAVTGSTMPPTLEPQVCTTEPSLIIWVPSSWFFS